MDEYDNIITLDGEEFLIVSELSYENRKYLYVTSLEKSDEIAILEETTENNEVFVESVKEEDFELIMSLFAKKLSEEQ